MSWQQFGFIVGFAFVALWALAGPGPALGALLLGAIGLYIGRVLDGKVNVAALVDRLGQDDRSR
ncbi:hypothetical protein [Stackebrandtia soli]|uniref:hypothetical protein n=1 Tax=Stackebrandtia soli TaxID=1892856 RepID=UPI0039ED5B1C